MTAIEKKRLLRANASAFRRSLSASDYSRASSSVVRNLRDLQEVADARSVHTFLPMTAVAELDIEPLINDLLNRNVEVAVPVVTSFSKGTAPGSVAKGTAEGTKGKPRLKHCRLTPTTELRQNQWGIREPLECQPADVAGIDVIIVPALACDRRGFRLGFGFGYYDEILAESTAVAVCPCYDSLLHDSLPTEEHDRPVDIIVTESSILRPNSSESKL
ncbi:MAG: 5-formyltetrahydrofolate cyclo-ligase [Rhodothermia bacterium]|nr:5-formyltetrahydrofolate cyclo-ligase [Rhodothermia bacterium]